MQSLSYHRVLERGFAVVRGTKGETIRSVEQLQPAMSLNVEVRDGKFQVEKPAAHKAASDAGSSMRQRAKPGSVRSLVAERGKSGGGQGSLF